MHSKFLKDRSYWGEGVPCEPDEPYCDEEDQDDDALGELLEYRRAEYRDAFFRYIHDSQETTRFFRYQDYLA